MSNIVVVRNLVMCEVPFPNHSSGHVPLLVADGLIAGLRFRRRGGMREMYLSFRDRTGVAVHASPVAAAIAPRAIRGFVIGGVGAVFLTIIGAVGTGGYPILHRLAYWLIVMQAGALIGFLVSTTVNLWGGLRSWPWLEGAAITAVITLPLSTLVIVANHLFFGGGFPPWPQMIVVGMVVMMFSGLMTAINYATAPKLPIMADAAPQHVPTTPVIVQKEVLRVSVSAQTRLAERLPPHLRQARLLAIEAEDHYLRAHTDAGSDLVLLRLTDAISELDSLPGARTHRSWWVARAAVNAACIENGRTMLTLTNNLTVPVSRTFRSHLQADGWFT